MTEELRALIEWHLSLGYDEETASRLALWCLDDSPAPGWTHKESQ
jgi:hypothetical protein